MPPERSWWKEEEGREAMEGEEVEGGGRPAAWKRRHGRGAQEDESDWRVGEGPSQRVGAT